MDSFVEVETAKGFDALDRRPELAKANADQAQAFAATLREIIEPIMCQSSRQIAAHLNARGVTTSTGSQWKSANVIPLINRLTGETDVA